MTVKNKKNIVIFSGAGLDKSSGINTFRDSNGIWNDYKIEDVATKESWKKDKEKVLNFYNHRRREMINIKPNIAHKSFALLEEKFNVTHITQNVSDLLEKAGCKNVIHLHGEIFKSRSTVDRNLIYDCTDEINLGDRCEKNSQLRPHVVFFGEDVPEISRAKTIIKNTDILIVVGTSLQVEPAAGLVRLAYWKPVYLVDPNPELANFLKSDTFNFIQERAEVGVPKLINELLYGAG